MCNQTYTNNFSYSTLPVIFHIKHHLVVLKFTLDEKQCKVVDIPISYENKKNKQRYNSLVDVVIYYGFTIVKV